MQFIAANILTFDNSVNVTSGNWRILSDYLEYFKPLGWGADMNTYITCIHLI